MSILKMMSLTIPTTPQSLSSSQSLSHNPILSHSLSLHLSHLSLTIPSQTTPVRMGGGPRTFPGGVSKWQWKRMQAKKAKQLLKARLTRERQIYDMRKRAELKAAVSELERPWETVEKPPALFSVSADEQLKVLADRFQKPGGLDLWSERDGPEIFRPDNGLPSARFFPKGVVHSVKPYGKQVGDSGTTEFEEQFESFGSDGDSGLGAVGRSVGKSGPGSGPVGRSVGRLGVGRKWYSRDGRSGSGVGEGSGSGNFKGKIGKGRSGMRYLSNRGEKSENTKSDAFDMNLQNDGSYGFESE